MKSTTLYNDRLIDLEMLQTITDPNGVKRVTISLAKSAPKIVTGIQKLAQRYANLFLTILGDIQFAQDIGTDFIRAVVSGTVAHYGQFFEAFALANTRTVSQLQVDTNGLPDDEIIESAELVDFNVSVSTGSVMLKVQITSLAGDTVEYVLPTTMLKG